MLPRAFAILAVVPPRGSAPRKSPMREFLQQGWVRSILLVLLGVIILVFIFLFGPQSSGFAPGTARWIAKVDGDPILNVSVDAAYQRYRQRFGSNGNLDDAAFLDLQRTLVTNDALVELLSKEAEDLGLAVSEREVQCYIYNWHRGAVVEGERICASFPESYETLYRNYDLPFYQDMEGNFSTSYERDVRVYFGMAVDAYQDVKEQELLAMRYLDLVARGIDVAPEQVQAAWERRNTTVDLEYVRIDGAAAVTGEVTDAELAAWRTENEAAVRAAYDENVADYEEPRQVRIRRIYFRKPSEDDPGFADAEANFRSVVERVTANGEDFEAVAREVAELDRDRESGGDMGLRTADSLSADLYDATVDMAVGEISEVDQTFAWNIIKLEEEVPARTRPFDEVADEIARQLLTDARREEALAGLTQRAERVLALAANLDSLQAAAEAEAAEQTPAAAEEGGTDEGDDAGEEEAAPAPAVTALPVATTGPFARERVNEFAAQLGPEFSGVVLPPPPADTIPGIGASRELVRIAFSLTEDAPLHGEVVEVDGVRYLVRLAARDDAGEMPADAFTQLYNELRGALADQIVGANQARIRLLADQPGPLSPYLQQLLDAAIDDGRIELRAGAFEVDPVQQI